MAKRNETTQAENIQAPETAEQTEDMDNAGNVTEQASAGPEQKEENAPETGSQAPEGEASSETGGQTTETPAVETEGPRLESLSQLADRHRIPAWHQAALLRYMGWQEGKMVTDADYREALEGLKNRRIGGGRAR